MTIRLLDPSETREAVVLAARAFYDDPLFRHVYPDPSRRLAGFAREHAAYVRQYYAPYGRSEVAEVDGALAGLALWLPPGAETPWWRDALTLPALARSVGLRRLRRVLRDYRAFDEAMPDGPFWYLGLLAVDPDAQGRGVGAALVRTGLTRADRDGQGTFLETGTEQNVAFYQRLGFRVTGEVLLDNGPTHWTMWREPAPGSDPAPG